MAIDSSKVEEMSDTLSNKGISNWIVGTIDTVAPGLVRISENVENIEITKH